MMSGTGTMCGCLIKDSAVAQPPRKGMVCQTTFDPI